MKNLKDCEPKNDKQIQKAQEAIFKKEVLKRERKTITKNVILLLVLLAIFLFLAKSFKDAQAPLHHMDSPDTGVHSVTSD